ncbi:nuclease domain-containing protein [Pontibacter vulgaris]|uniref:nuclease domain-containing protein n=1 Tax=Pontibacter vulgaris TaxID=2905679 RepID=UPI001FA7934F|nr:nuclease domain-containing protein [Pontibacter vulgaris]
MFKVFEIINGQYKEVPLVDGLYTVHELGHYQLEYAATEVNHNVFFIEDEHINERHIKEKGPNKVITKQFRFFEDYFGFAKVQINEEVFQFNILGEKFELKEIEDIILYLFEHNHLVLNEFVSKSSIGGDNVYKGKEYLYSSKYLNLIDNFCTIFEQLFISFKSVPHTVIRKRFEVSSYSNQAVDNKSIEWVLQNLDTVLFDNSLKYHPDAINVSNDYGLIETIGSDKNISSFATYENEIILGAFYFLKKVISEIKSVINARLNLNNNSQDSYVLSQYTDFRDLKKIPFLRLLKNLENLDVRVSRVAIRYQNLFKDAKPNNQFPKLTPIFYKYRHYQKAFNQIKLLRNSNYNIAGEIHLLNIRKLSELYELYNLNVIVEILSESFDNNLYEKEITYSDKHKVISKIVFKNLSSNITVTLFYQPLINNNTKGLDLITIGNLKLQEKHCKPDFVLEIRDSSELRYYVLDAKYSKINTVKNLHLTTCLKKYIIDVGIKDKPYQKPDYLILLHPDSNDDESNLIYSESHYPKIRTLISKPNYRMQIRDIIKGINGVSR